MTSNVALSLRFLHFIWCEISGPHFPHDYCSAPSPSTSLTSILRSSKKIHKKTFYVFGRWIQWLLLLSRPRIRTNTHTHTLDFCITFTIFDYLIPYHAHRTSSRLANRWHNHTACTLCCWVVDGGEPETVTWMSVISNSYGTLAKLRLRLSQYMRCALSKYSISKCCLDARQKLLPMQKIRAHSTSAPNQHCAASKVNLCEAVFFATATAANALHPRPIVKFK